MSVSGSASSSARVPRPASSGPTIAALVPWTWRAKTNVSSPTPKAAAARARFVTTASGASPTWSPRLSVSYGGADTPWCRVVTATAAPASSARGQGRSETAGASGTGADHIEPGWRSRRVRGPRRRR